MSDSARIVIIGGGVGGASVAYHLTELGERDVLVLERDELTSGSTFHSAGLVGQLRADPTLTRMNQYSVELYRTLDGWSECGGIKLASTPERMEEIRRQIGWARTFGLPLEEISVDEAVELFPLMDPAGVVGAAYLPTDGQIDPSQLCYALAARARAGGARIRTHTRVLGISVVGGRVSGVRTDQGDISCEIIVNCGGMFAPEIGRMAGVRIPIVPMSHQYVVTEGFHSLERLPTLRDPDLLVYYRQEVQGLVMGGYERDSAPWVDPVPADFNGRLLPDDWERLADISRNSAIRVPSMGDVGIRKLINGPEAFTPDNEFCLGETEVGGFFVAAGFCAHGIAGAGGIGRVMAEWIVSGEPTWDVWHMDIRRFGRQYRSPSYTRKRVVENYETYYDIRYPGHERSAGRPLKVSPAYGWHQAHGAVFGEKSGWERVNYYTSNTPTLTPSNTSTTPTSSTASTSTPSNSPTSAAITTSTTPDEAPSCEGAHSNEGGLSSEEGFSQEGGIRPERGPLGEGGISLVGESLVRGDGSREGGGRVGVAVATGVRPRGWAGRHWSPAIGAEHLATREAAGLFDETSFAKIEVTGPDAADLLEWVCDNRVARKIGDVTYTQALNRRGGIECDFTVTRRGEEEFLIVTGTAFGSHDLGWLRKQATAREARVRIADVTGQYACFGLWGPRARDILGTLTPDPLTFPFMSSRELTVGDVPALALRVTFVGELGWELYCSSEYGLALWQTLWAAGRPYGMVAGGYKAIDSLRLEKGYRVWGADIGPETTPYEAGLGFCVARDKDFLGRDALVDNPGRRLRCITLDDPGAVALGNEPVRAGGEVVGRVTSGGYGYTVGLPIAYAYLPVEVGTKVEVDVFGSWIPGVVAQDPLYDPRSTRVRA